MPAGPPEAVSGRALGRLHRPPAAPGAECQSGWEEPGGGLLSRDWGGAPSPGRLLCRVARVSSWLFRMMVWEAVGMGSEAVLPSELCSLCMWNLRWPFRLNLQAGEGCPHSAAKTRAPQRTPPKDEPHPAAHLWPQMWQAKGFSLVWVSVCLRRSFLFLEAKLQCWHLWGRRLACCSRWLWGGEGG